VAGEKPSTEKFHFYAMKCAVIGIIFCSRRISKIVKPRFLSGAHRIHGEAMDGKAEPFPWLTLRSQGFLPEDKPTVGGRLTHARPFFDGLWGLPPSVPGRRRGVGNA
jgi:hypothetical protein